MWLWGVPCLALAVLFFLASALCVRLFFATRKSSFPSWWALPMAAFFGGSAFVHLTTYFVPTGVNIVSFLVAYWFAAVVGVLGVAGVFRSTEWLAVHKDKTEHEIKEAEARLASLLEAERLMKGNPPPLTAGEKSNAVG